MNHDLYNVLVDDATKRGYRIGLSVCKSEIKSKMTYGELTLTKDPEHRVPDAIITGVPLYGGLNEAARKLYPYLD